MNIVLRAALLLAVALFGRAPEVTAASVGYAEVAAIFAARCVICHAGPHAPAGLKLDSLENLLAGSGSGPVARAGDPQGSELLRRVKGLSQPRMPMTGPPFLEEREIGLIENWIAAGMPAGTAPPPDAAPTVTEEPPGELTYAAVAPLLAARCVKCHAENGLMGPAPEGYLLTSHAATVSARDRVRVVPGYPAASELVRRLKGTSRPRMPFDGPPFLEDRETALLADWIARGALDADLTPSPYPLGARIRLQGILDDATRLDDGVVLQFSSATRVDKAPRPGDYVEVRGRLGAAGRIDVERLRRR